MNRTFIGQGNLEALEIANDAATAVIYRMGAHVTSFIPKGQPDLLFLSQKSEFSTTGKPIRGGIPVCWPWFGPANPALIPNATTGHGFARQCIWDVVSVRDLSFRYMRKGEWIYRGFSASLPRGKVAAIVGANGAGKTTLARLLCGLLKPVSGEIAIDGGACAAQRFRRERTAFVMQQMDIQLYMRTVEEELLFSSPRSVAKAERRADAARWLDVFGLSHLKSRHPHSLSGGEKQRLVVACALMKRPQLMILDEPTSGLDGRNMRIIARELRAYVSRGGTALLITHDLELLSLVADCRLEIPMRPSSAAGKEVR